MHRFVHRSQPASTGFHTAKYQSSPESGNIHQTKPFRYFFPASYKSWTITSGTTKFHQRGFCAPPGRKPCMFLTLPDWSGRLVMDGVRVSPALAMSSRSWTRSSTSPSMQTSRNLKPISKETRTLRFFVAKWKYFGKGTKLEHIFSAPCISWTLLNYCCGCHQLYIRNKKPFFHARYFDCAPWTGHTTVRHHGLRRKLERRQMASIRRCKSHGWLQGSWLVSNHVQLPSFRHANDEWCKELLKRQYALQHNSFVTIAGYKNVLSKIQGINITL